MTTLDKIIISLIKEANELGLQGKKVRDIISYYSDLTYEPKFKLIVEKDETKHEA